MEGRKKDLRYIKTEKAMRKAFHELLQEKELKRITVRELAERAEINKTTFYAHYETIPNLLDTLEVEQIGYIVSHLDQVNLLFEDPDLFINNLYRNIQDCNITSIRKIGAGNQEFVNRLKASVEGDLASRKIDPNQYNDVAAILVFIFYGLLGIVNMESNSENSIQYIKAFVKKGLK